MLTGICNICLTLILELFAEIKLGLSLCSHDPPKLYKLYFTSTFSSATHTSAPESINAKILTLELPILILIKLLIKGTLKLQSQLLSTVLSLSISAALGACASLNVVEIILLGLSQQLLSLQLGLFRALL